MAKVKPKVEMCYVESYLIRAAKQADLERHPLEMEGLWRIDSAMWSIHNKWFVPGGKRNVQRTKGIAIVSGRFIDAIAYATTLEGFYPRWSHHRGYAESDDGEVHLYVPEDVSGIIDLEELLKR